MEGLNGVLMAASVRVLMALTYFHPIMSGMERQAFALGQQLVRRGHTVTVATCKFPSLNAHEIVEGIRVDRVIRPLARGALYAGSYLGSLSAYLLAHRKDYDLIHAHMLFLDAYAAGMVGSMVKKPVVAKVAGGGACGDVARLGRVRGGAWLRAGLRRIPRIVATSDHVIHELVEAGFSNERIIRLPNGVDTERFRPAVNKDLARQALGVSGDVVVFAGRLHPDKDVQTLLEAWSRVSQTRPSAVLLLLGQGPQEEHLRREVVQRGLAKQVVFCGEQPDVAPYLQAADLFVLPSRAEGMSNALLEAMACEVPCIASRIGGNVDVIQDGVNGRLVEVGRAEALAHTILDCLNDRPGAMRLGVAARQTVEKRYVLTDLCDRYVELYAELLNGSSQR